MKNDGWACKDNANQLGSTISVHTVKHYTNNMHTFYKIPLKISKTLTQFNETIMLYYTNLNEMSQYGDLFPDLENTWT